MSTPRIRLFRFGSAAIAAVMAAGALAACSNASNPVSPGLAATGGTAVKGEPEVGPELAAVRAATSKYHDVAVAIADGYADPVTGHCEEINIGGMGVHAVNGALIGNQALDPLHPEVLLYQPKPDGGFKLIGVEYVQFVLLRNPATGVVAPWTAAAPWPASYQIVNATPELFGHTFQGPMPGHFPGMPWHWDLHVWIWANNPAGMFEPWNPAISCRE